LTSRRVWEGVERDSLLMVEYVAGRPESGRVVHAKSDQMVIALGLGVGGGLTLAGLFVLTRSFRAAILR